jgi:hypothetical protein
MEREMSIRLSTGLRNKVLVGGAGGGVKGALDLGFIYVYPGAQPTTPDLAATGTLLGKISISALGVTGLTFAAPAVLGVLSKTPAELWQFKGLADGQAGWFRFAEAGDNPAAPSNTAARLDGTIGTAGADMDIANSNIAVDSINTADQFTVTMPGA